ncbi:COP9 signalosome complex subunit 2 [Fistulifera solaris]|jgi:COP9 signalosome complex subunit 2|uniref:COP9 signalosome complex subunit 2 n=1 Tax=Fistulifera solaris TaxID=1519565 RepID=A0A1Z5KQJ3_FISSO|nr:COP9 signalosome complex subunit 2 [Fistulifera solaris]|eukprot:GAX28583.1 COP9 signalosome complex subunit 2 [Fistulifera solaris]
MSDEEDYEYEYDEDEDAMEEQPDFEYTDEEEEQDDGQVALENLYYNAKGMRDTDAAEAKRAFEDVIVQERKQSGDDAFGPWSFKAIKQLVKLHLRSNEDVENTRKLYSRLLECISTGKDISPNAVEKGINGMLERVASLYQTSKSATGSSTAQTLAVAVYDDTLQVFHPVTGSCKNERLWFKANLKYGQLLYEMNETGKLQKVLKDVMLHQQGNETSATSSSSTQTMEIYALQIQLYSRQKDHKRLRETFRKAMAVRGGIPHPRTLALMQELGGKMHMAAREYEAAGKTFFQAFKSYDEAGDPSRLRCLKYLVMASMLHASSINPFDSQEARPYRDDPEILAMTNLVQAFHNNEIQTFEKILRQNQGRIMEDEFIREHIEDLLRTIRTQVLRRVIQPYKRITLKAIAHELNDIPVSDVESLLVGLILDGLLDGRIDKVDGILIKNANAGSTGLGSTVVSPRSGDGAADGNSEEACCANMQTMIDSLERLSAHITSIKTKDGRQMRSVVA